MKRSRYLVYASVVAAAFGVGGVVGAAAIAIAPLITANAASPSPPPAAAASPKSNEDPTHETGESAAQETAENNGTAHIGGGNGPSNETSAHESNESAAREAAEKT